MLTQRWEFTKRGARGPLVLSSTSFSSSTSSASCASNSHLDQLSQPLRLRPTHRHLALLFVIHLQHVTRLEPRHHFLDVLNANQVRPVRSPSAGHPLRPFLHRPQPHFPNQRAPRVDHSPITSKALPRRSVGCIHPRFRRDHGFARPGVFHPKIHRREREPRLFQLPEPFRRRLPLRSPSRRRRDQGPDHQLAVLFLRQQQKTCPRGHIEQGHCLRRIQNALRSRPAKPPHPRQRPKQCNLPCPYLFDRAKHSIPRGPDSNRMCLIKLPSRHKRIELCPRCCDSFFAGRKQEANADYDHSDSEHNQTAQSPGNPDKVQWFK